MSRTTQQHLPVEQQVSGHSQQVSRVTRHRGVKCCRVVTEAPSFDRLVAGIQNRDARLRDKDAADHPMLAGDPVTDLGRRAVRVSHDFPHCLGAPGFPLDTGVTHHPHLIPAHPIEPVGIDRQPGAVPLLQRKRRDDEGQNVPLEGRHSQAAVKEGRSAVAGVVCARTRCAAKSSLTVRAALCERNRNGFRVSGSTQELSTVLARGVSNTSTSSSAGRPSNRPVVSVSVWVPKWLLLSPRMSVSCRTTVKSEKYFDEIVFEPAGSVSQSPISLPAAPAEPVPARRTSAYERNELVGMSPP